jgi:monoamine oxidase
MHLEQRAVSTGRVAIRRSTPVSMIHQHASGAVITTIASEGVTPETIEASAVIVTLPLGVLKHSLQMCPLSWQSRQLPDDSGKNVVQFSPKLSQRKLDAIQGLGVGLLNKVVFGFETPFWNEENHAVMCT